MNTKTVIIIVGATASGKTALSLQLAALFNTEIISADSRQCYKELNIGVAKPTEEELHSIKHYFINSHSINDTVNAQVFENYSLNAAEEIFKNHDVAIMVGGTGMYIKAFCEGLDVIPETDTVIRNELINIYKEKGLQWLQTEVQKNDPAFWLQAEQQNPQRLMRALEVFLSTKRSILNFRQKKIQNRPFNIKKIGLNLLKEKLHRNIDARTNKMVEDGLVEEVSSLKKYQHLNALQTVGYKEIFEYLSNKCSLEEAAEKIKQHTKQYAKRQFTWFKKDKTIKWISEWKSIR